MDWSANGWTIVGLVISVLGAAFSGSVYWNRDNFKRRLRDEAAIRFDAAKALTAPKPWDMYLGALGGALDRLTSWMGKRARLAPKDGSRGEWGKSANWCFILAMIYPFVFLLTSWLFGAHITNHARAAHLNFGTRPPRRTFAATAGRRKNGPAPCPPTMVSPA